MKILRTQELKSCYSFVLRQLAFSTVLSVSILFWYSYKYFFSFFGGQLHEKYPRSYFNPAMCYGNLLLPNSVLFLMCFLINKMRLFCMTWLMQPHIIDACIQEVICRDFYKGFYRLADAIVLWVCFFFSPQNYWNYSLCEPGAARIWYRTKCFRFDLCTDFDLVSVTFTAKTSFALRNTMEHSYSDISGCFPSQGKEQDKCLRWHIKYLCKDCDLPVLCVITQAITITLISSLPCGHLVWQKPVKRNILEFCFLPHWDGVPVEVVSVLNPGKDALFLRMSMLLQLQQSFADMYIGMYVWSCIFLKVDLLLQDDC